MSAQEAFDPEAIRQITGSITAEATSEDRSITVTAGPGNRVIDIAYSSRAFRLGREELSEMTLALIKEAGRQADEESARAVAPFFEQWTKQ